jgi:hypothetical protein
MKLKKSLLLTAVAVAMLAVPASALAAQWLDGGKSFKEHREMKLAGGEVIELGEAGEKDVMLCESTPTISTEGGSTGTLTDTVLPKTCTGLAGKLVGCTVSSVSTSGSPWAVTVNTVDATAKSVKFTYALAAGCSISSIEFTVPELKLVPLEEPSSIRGFQWSAEVSGKVNGATTAVGYFGSGNLPEGEFGTYGIG